MNQIEELQSRITAAIERIGAGVAELSVPVEVPAPEADPEQIVALETALDEEKLANAQLSERLKRLKARHAQDLAEAGGGADLPALQAELTTVRDVAAQASERADELTAQLAEAKARIEADDSDALRAELDLARAKLEDRSEIEALQAELDALRTEASASDDAELAAVQAQLAATQTAFDAAKADWANEREALQQAPVADSGDSDALRAEIEALKSKYESDISALQDELAAAQAPQPDTSEADALRAELDALKAEQARAAEAAELAAVQAELNGDTSSNQAELLQADLETLKTEYDLQAQAMGQLDQDLQRLRGSNDKLREAIGDLREANAQGVGDPALINKAMLAELEGLRATRASDMTEAGAVLAKLEPLLAQAANLPEGEVE